MKKIQTSFIASTSLASAFVLLLIFTSCSTYTDEQPTLSFLQIAIDTTGVEHTVLAASAVVSASNEDNSVVLSQQHLGVYLTETGYVTEEVEVTEGMYDIQSVEVLDYSGELVLLVPKHGTVAAARTGSVAPEHVRLQGRNHQQIPVKAYSPHQLGIHPSEFGYGGYEQWGRVPQNNSGVTAESICLRIGVDGPYDPLEPIPFQVFSDDSIVLYGECTKGIAEFMLPMAQDGYILETIMNNGVQRQQFKPSEMQPFSCKDPGKAFVNLMPFEERNPDAEILFIRQVWEFGDLVAEMTFVDSDGAVFKASSDRVLQDWHFDGDAHFSSDDYTYFEELMVNKVGYVNSDSLLDRYAKAEQLKPEMLPKEHREIFNDRLYVILSGAKGGYEAIQVNWWFDQEPPEKDSLPPLNDVTEWFNRSHVFGDE